MLATQSVAHYQTTIHDDLGTESCSTSKETRSSNKRSDKTNEGNGRRHERIRKCLDASITNI